jgi:hypothetical protein
MMTILILIIFTYSLSDRKIKLIMSENNANKNSMDNLIRQNINCHLQYDDQIHYYSMRTWTKKSFSRKAHNGIKLIHKSHCLLHNESLSMAWKLSTHAIYNNNLFIMWCPTYLQNLQTSCGTYPFWGALLLDSEEEP